MASLLRVSSASARWLPRVLLWAALISMFGAPVAAQAASPAGRAGVDDPIKTPFTWFYNYHSGKCISVAHASKSNGAAIWQFGCTNKMDFGWIPTSGFTGRSTYFIRNENSAKCMAVKNNSRAKGAAIVQEPCKPSNPPVDQRFQFIGLGFKHGYSWLLIRSVRSSLCVHVRSDSKKNEAILEQWSCPLPQGKTNFSEWFIFVKAGTHLPCPCSAARRPT
jgi:hypothetical protein